MPAPVPAPAHATVQIAQGMTEAIRGSFGEVCQSEQTKHGNLTVIKELGRGGMGAVYLVERSGPSDPEMPRRFALKQNLSPGVFRPGIDHNIKEHLPERYEAALQRYMRHENIVATYWSDVRVLDPKTERPLAIGANDLMPGDWMSMDELDGLEKTYTAAYGNNRSGGAARPRYPEVKLQMRIAMEACDLGSLMDYLTHGRVRPAASLSERLCQKKLGRRVDAAYVALMTALDIVEATRFMHKNRILHGDFKPQNVLITSDDSIKGFRAKLSDFGLSAHLGRDEEFKGITSGTVAYLPKDTLQTYRLTESSDMYAIGLLMWEIWHGRFWFSLYDAEKKRIGGRGHQDMWHYKPTCANDCPAEYAALINACLSEDPAQRPTARAVARSLAKMSAELEQQGL